MLRRTFLALPATASFVFGAGEAAPPTRVAQNIGAGEGPAWHDGWLWFTGSNRISRRHGATGRVEVWKENAGGANGLLFDSDGTLVVCEGVSRRVVRYDVASRRSAVLAERFDGKRLNSPNDLTRDRRGRIYFSDPRYGDRASMEMDQEAVYRIDAPGKITRVLGKQEGVQRPNGVLLVDDRYLYVADNNNNTAGGARKLWRFTFRPDSGTVEAGSKTLVYDWGSGRGPDGLAAGADGRLYVAAGRTVASPPWETADQKGGVYVLSPVGRLLTFLPVTDDEVTNCAFGGPDGKTLFITAGGSLWASQLP
jgi:gluconolactonase